MPSDNETAPETAPPAAETAEPGAAAKALRLHTALDMLDTLIDLDSRIGTLEALAGLT
jgi:hypothetical protein